MVRRVNSSGFFKGQGVARLHLPNLGGLGNTTPAWKPSIYQGIKAVSTTKVGEALATGVNMVAVDNDLAGAAVSIGFVSDPVDIPTASEDTSVPVNAGIDQLINVPAGSTHVVWWVAAGSGTIKMTQGVYS